jgi:hypothetical protein
MRITETDSETLDMFARWPDDTWRESMNCWFSEHGEDAAYRIPYMLNHGLLYWPKVPEFNDPFDGSIQVDVDVRYDLLRERLNILYTNGKLTAEEEAQLGSEYGVDYLSRSPTANQQEHADRTMGIEMCRAATQRLINGSRVLSFSETWDNILMWSHYADSHRGLCLGFCVSRTDRDRFFKNVFYPSEATETSRPTLDFTHEEWQSGNAAAKAIYVKSHDWNYEKEVRFVDPWPGPEYCNLQPLNGSKLTLGEMIYGCRMTRDHRIGVKRIVAFKETYNIEIFNATMNPSHFRVDRERHEA